MARLTQEIIDTLTQADPKARVTQAAVEVLSASLKAAAAETHAVIFVCM